MVFELNKNKSNRGKLRVASVRGTVLAALLMMVVLSVPSSLEAAWWFPFKKKKETAVAERGDEKQSGGFLGFGKKEPLGVGQVNYRNVTHTYEKDVPRLWKLVSTDKIYPDLMWIGTTYKDMPYTEKEFLAIRKRRVDEELKVLKKEYVAKRKAEASENMSTEEAENLLDTITLGGESADAEKKEVDESKYLEGFDEQVVRRRIQTRIFIPQSHSVKTKSLYFQQRDNQLYCVELETGIIVWVLKLQSKIDAVPYETDEALYFFSEGDFLGVDKQAGLLLFKSKVDRACLSVPYVHDSHHVLGTYRRRVILWDKSDNIPIWQRQLTGEISHVLGTDDLILAAQENGILTGVGFDGSIRWNFVNKGYTEDRVYLEAMLRKLRQQIVDENTSARRDAREPDKQLLMRLNSEIDRIESRITDLENRTRGRFLARPVVSMSSIFVGSTDFNLYCLNRYSGIPNWQYTTKGPIEDSPIASNRNVFQVDGRNILHKVSIETGRAVEMIHGVHRLLYADDSSMFYFTGDGILKTKTSRGEGRLSGFGRLSKIFVDSDPDVLVGAEPDERQIYVWDLSVIYR